MGRVKPDMNEFPGVRFCAMPCSSRDQEVGEDVALLAGAIESNRSETRHTGSL
jgi:hypothetical protein